MLKRHLGGLIVAALVAGGGATAWAAAPDTPGTTATADAKSRPTAEQAKACRDAHKAGQEPSEDCQQFRQQKRRRHASDKAGGAILRHTIHGDLVVKGKDGAIENVTLDKGTVESKGDRTITLKREDGKSVTLKVDDETRYKGVDDFAGVQTGKPAVIISKDGVARSVGQRGAGREQPAPG